MTAGEARDRTPGNGRRRGRPQRLPEDPHPIGSGAVGCEQRIAWLLTVNRVFGADPDLARREGFIAALQDRGVAVDASRVSRWESGLRPLPTRVIATYESVLGLPEGALVAVARGLRRAFGTDPGAREDPAREDELSNAEVESLLERVEQGAATGAHWMRLADQLDRYDRVFLRERERMQLCQTLVQELGVSAGCGYVRRYEAAAAFVRQPDVRRHLVMAIGGFVTDPDAQVLPPVLNLLSEVSDPAAAELTMRMLSDGENKHLRRAASSVAAVKLARGHFGADALPGLESHVLGALRRGDSLDGRLDALDLAARLPEQSWERVGQGLRTRRSHTLVEQAREHDELVPRARAASLVAELAPAIQAETPAHQPQEPDLMLRRLLREALLHSHKPRRHHAALLLAATPYAAAVARHMLRLAAEANELLAARAWTVLMRVGHCGRRGALVERALGEDRPSIRARALVNVGLGTGELADDEARQLVAGLEESRAHERQATLFALGMTGSAELKALADFSDEAIGPMARWWLRRGPAIHDRDVPQFA